MRSLPIVRKTKGMTEDGRGKSEGSRRTQFPPGVSGNRGGRPAGAKGLRSELRQELNEIVEVTEGGRVRRLPKRRLVLKSLIAKAAKGDVRAAEKIVGLIIQFEGFEDQRPKHTTLSSHDQSILDHFLGGSAQQGDGARADGEDDPRPSSASNASGDDQ